MWKKLTLLFCLLGIGIGAAVGQSSPRAEFITLESARPILNGMGGALPGDLAAKGLLDAASWSEWVQGRDRGVRNRLIRGEEDTLANLLRFGVTFTSEYRIDDEFLASYGTSSLVNSFANNRADDLIRAWGAPHPSEGLGEMLAFVEKRGYSVKSASDRAELKKYLLANLTRLRDDYLAYKALPKDDRRFQMFQNRGISLDSNLWPDYVLDVAFRQLATEGLLKPGALRRVAIVGPGLDFANKELGCDFYPPQTIQPFAVLDSLLRLGLAKPDAVEVDALDISENVNLHLSRIRARATEGQPYALQLPWNSERPMSVEYQSGFVKYWQALGSQIGKIATPIPVPAAASSTHTRAIQVRPEIAERVAPVDLDVVYQRLDAAPGSAYDLIIGTNIFLYYGAFEQSLARANLAAMMKPGAILISNDKLADSVPAGLKDVQDVQVDMSEQPLIRDIAFCYQRVTPRPQHSTIDSRP
jgi:hypothetical protein